MIIGFDDVRGCLEIIIDPNQILCVLIAVLQLTLFELLWLIRVITRQLAKRFEEILERFDVDVLVQIAVE